MENAGQPIVLVAVHDPAARRRLAHLLEGTGQLRVLSSLPQAQLVDLVLTDQPVLLEEVLQRWPHAERVLWGEELQGKPEELLPELQARALRAFQRRQPGREPRWW